MSKGGLHLSPSAKRAEAAMDLRCKELNALDFHTQSSSQVWCEDGSYFSVRCSFLEEWVDPVKEQKWVFMFCEHYPALSFDADDLLVWTDSSSIWCNVE